MRRARTSWPRCRSPCGASLHGGTARGIWASPAAPRADPPDHFRAGMWVWVESGLPVVWQRPRVPRSAVTLQDGWQLVAWPAAGAAAEGVVDAAGGITAVWGWDALQQTFVLYRPQFPAAATLTRVGHLQALWVRAVAPGGPWPVTCSFPRRLSRFRVRPFAARGLVRQFLHQNVAERDQICACGRRFGHVHAVQRAQDESQIRAVGEDQEVGGHVTGPAIVLRGSIAEEEAHRPIPHVRIRLPPVLKQGLVRADELHDAAGGKSAQIGTASSAASELSSTTVITNSNSPDSGLANPCPSEWPGSPRAHQSRPAPGRPPHGAETRNIVVEADAAESRREIRHGQLGQWPGRVRLPGGHPTDPAAFRCDHRRRRPRSAGPQG